MYTLLNFRVWLTEEHYNDDGDDDDNDNSGNKKKIKNHSNCRNR
jgi:hypothetical protein